MQCSVHTANKTTKLNEVFMYACLVAAEPDEVAHVAVSHAAAAQFRGGESARQPRGGESERQPSCQDPCHPQPDIVAWRHGLSLGVRVWSRQMRRHLYNERIVTYRGNEQVAETTDWHGQHCCGSPE